MEKHKSYETVKKSKLTSMKKIYTRPTSQNPANEAGLITVLLSGIICSFLHRQIESFGSVSFWVLQDKTFSILWIFRVGNELPVRLFWLCLVTQSFLISSTAIFFPQGNNRKFALICIFSLYFSRNLQGTNQMTPVQAKAFFFNVFCLRKTWAFFPEALKH